MLVYPFLPGIPCSSAHTGTDLVIGSAVGMVKNPNSEASEFHIQNEDFPALPGSNHTNLGNQQSPSTTGPQQDTSGNPGSNSQQQISQQVIYSS